jgi:hypothetical protein
MLTTNTIIWLRGCWRGRYRDHLRKAKMEQEQELSAALSRPLGVGLRRAAGNTFRYTFGVTLSCVSKRELLFMNLSHLLSHSLSSWLIFYRI